MNWATTSRYDILQKVIIGGNTVSKQGNANTLLSISGTWSKTYGNCKFDVSNANLTISDLDTSNTCALLDSPSTPVAFWDRQPFNTILAFFSDGLSRIYRTFSSGIKGIYSLAATEISDIYAMIATGWDSISIIAKAWAGQACSIAIDTSSSLNGTAGTAYSIKLNGSGGTGSNNFSWSTTTRPAWLTGGPALSGTRNSSATWSGTPTTPGDYTFTATANRGTGGSAGCDPETVTYTGTIRISCPAAPRIVTTSLTGGTYNTPYSYTVTGTDGTPDASGRYIWSATGLPNGLTIGGSTGTISGTPSQGGSFNVAVTLSDYGTGSCYQTVSKTFTLTISGGPPPLSIDTTSPLPGGMTSSTYSRTITGSGGSGSGYTWAITSGYLPFGLFLNPSTGVISGNTCPFTGSGSNGSNGDTCLKTDQFSAVSGHNYTVAACSGDGGSNTGDSWLRLTGTPSGTLNDDDGCPDAADTLGSRLTFTAGSSGTVTVCESTYLTFPATWSYNIKDTTDTRECAGTFPFTVSLTDSIGTTVTRDLSITINATAVLAIDTTALPAGVKNTAYSYTLTGSGGPAPFTWSATGLPASLSINASTGVISGTPAANEVGIYTVTITLRDNSGNTVSKTFTLNILRVAAVRSQTYNVKVDIFEETLDDLNGNDIWDRGETYTEVTGNDQWDGKQGVFQKFWDSNNPKARWGMTKFGRQGATVTVDVDSCIPASPASAFYTRVQNATPTDESPLSAGLYGDLSYYAFNNDGSYSGCTNADPIDDVPCRKNFVLILSSGSNVTGANRSQSDCSVTNNTAPLVQNACYGYKTDLRADKSGKQNVYTYAVNTMGTANNAILQDAAIAGGGKYYDASDASNLESQLVRAFTDILGQAASGTAVSVLTTSSRGIGSMVQSYFLPTKQEGTREVWWTGYTKQIWIDNQDNLREDSINDTKLKLAEDKVMKLYFDQSSNETKAAMFTTNADGNDDGSATSLTSCSAPTIKPFSDVVPLWEAGKKLALRNPSDRTIFSSKKVIKGGTTTNTFTDTCTGTPNPDAPCFNTSMASTLKDALDPDATYTSDNIIKYIRGECLETGVMDDTACGGTAGSTYRDRRLTSSTVSGLSADGNVWKLGDVISSTPKVFSNTPLNAYNTNYGDNTYYSYVTSDSYKQRSALAFIGANDGMVHAFRVGYLKDKRDNNGDLPSAVKALFRNLYSSSDDTNDDLGEEVWGYIPFNAFPYLKYLANPGYCHIYFNDLSVRLVDASIGGSTALPTDTRTQADWRSILIGGMRFGGACNAGVPDIPVAGVGYSSYFAIDITDPENPVPMWEFSDDDMGYATTYPSIVRTGDRAKNGYWYVAIGSGSKQLPKSGTDISRTSEGYVYLLDLKTGALVKKIPLGHNAIVGDILAIDQDKDYVSEAIYFGTAYKDTTWKGKLGKIDILNQDLSSAWTPTITYLFSGDYPFTASPDATKDTEGNIWVYAGSGKYYSDVDESDTSAQIFLGIKDSATITYPQNAVGLTDRTTTTTTGTVTGITTACLYDSTTNSYGLRTLVTSITPTSSAASVPAVGWKQVFSTGERVITRPLAVGGLVDFLTYKPSADPCSYGGESYLYSLGYTTGVAPATVAIRAPEATGGTTTGTVTVARGILLGPGAPPTGEAIIIPPPKEGQESLKKKIQIATGVIVEAENSPVFSVISKIVHWLKK